MSETSEKRVFIRTYGCQMNVYDSERMAESLSKAGYTTLGVGKLFHHPAGMIDQRGWDTFFLRNPEEMQKLARWMNLWLDEFSDPASLISSLILLVSDTEF